MDEALYDAKQELKRVDHLIYVSLKYTRTADVLKNVIERLVSSLDFLVIAVLQKAKDDNKITEMSTAPMQRCDQLHELYSDNAKITEICGFYSFLRRINKLDYQKESEYRRHVAMIFSVDGDIVKVDIDKVTDYYKQVKEYLGYINQEFGPND